MAFEVVFRENAKSPEQFLFAGNRKEKCLNVKQSSKQCCKVREVAGKCKEGGKPALWGEKT